MRRELDVTSIASVARRIKKAKIDFISLVPKGANKMQAIYKDDGSIVIDTLTKIDNEQGELIAVVYAAEHEDSQGHIASAEVIKKMAHEYQRDSRQIDLRHNGKALNERQAYVAESFLVRKGDETFRGWKDTDGKPVDLTGAWATVIKLEDPELRRLAREEKWSVSLAGTGALEKELEDESLNASLDRFAEIFLGRLGKATKTEDKMDPKDISEITKGVVEALKPATEALTQLAKALTPKLPANDTGGTPALPEIKEPVFRGNWADEKAVRKHERELQVHELRLSHDTKTADGFRSFREQYTELQKSWKEEDVQLAKEAAEARKSNQDGAGGKNKDEDADSPAPATKTNFKKEEADAYEDGRSLFNPKLKKVAS